MSRRFLFLLFLWVSSLLSGREISTFYGSIEVQEPILLELIDSPAFQRLKSIHQYGIAYYTTHNEEYNRYDHSIGVFTILRKKGASLEEQISGLLHDVSHTVFSHVGDWIFNKENQEKDYQNSIHHLFLKQSGLEEILNKYQIDVNQILPEEALFPALENALPNLCADRIDYNIQGAFYQGFITKEEAVYILEDLKFVDNRWVSTRPDLMKKLMLFSLFMTQDCWGGPLNYLTSRWLADAILRGIDLNEITYEELHYGTDQEIWDYLISNEDPIIKKNMHKILHASSYFSLVESQEEADMCIKSKFRGINPWVKVNSTILRLTESDAALKEHYESIRQQICNGWLIKL